MVNWWVLLDSHTHAREFIYYNNNQTGLVGWTFQTPLLLLLLLLLLAAAKKNDSQLTGTYAPTSVGQFLAFMKKIVWVYKIKIRAVLVLHINGSDFAKDKFQFQFQF
jgi:hypothetical protein